MVVKYVVLDLGDNSVGLYQTIRGASGKIGVSELTFRRLLVSGCSYYDRFKLLRDVVVEGRVGHGRGLLFGSK